MAVRHICIVINTFIFMALGWFVSVGRGYFTFENLIIISLFGSESGCYGKMFWYVFAFGFDVLLHGNIYNTVTIKSDEFTTIHYGDRSVPACTDMNITTLHLPISLRNKPYVVVFWTLTEWSRCSCHLLTGSIYFSTRCVIVITHCSPQPHCNCQTTTAFNQRYWAVLTHVYSTCMNWLRPRCQQLTTVQSGAKVLVPVR